MSAVGCHTVQQSGDAHDDQDDSEHGWSRAPPPARCAICDMAFLLERYGATAAGRRGRARS
jgi:hypothetical protein